jgi:hypothetical protein
VLVLDLEVLLVVLGHTPKVRFSATLGREPEVEVTLT